MKIKSLSLKLVTGLLFLGLAGCVTTGDITPNYVSPSGYAQYDCQTLEQEYQRIEKYVQTVQKKNNPLSATGISIGLSANSHGIYPTLGFGLGTGGGKSARNAELAKLFGEHDAIVQAGRMQKCTFVQGVKIYSEK